MPEENKKQSDYNIFITTSIYPEAASVFTSRLKSLEEIKDDCYVVLDTNVLLTPYSVGEADLLDQCRKTYKFLIAQGRLIIPGQVAREFAKNRAGKLAELYQQLCRKKQLQQIQSGKYPLLGSLAEYKEVTRLEKEINNKIQEYQIAVNKVLEYIQGWQWNDPVSLLYHELFTGNVVLEPQISEEYVKEDLDRRQLHKIPPGYKDAAKEDKGVGDLLIWHTILEIGKTQKKSVIFVSGDEKADWFQQSEKLPLYPRYELVDEFRRLSDEHSFHIIKFSRFLELFGANETIVEEVKREEGLLNRQIIILPANPLPQEISQHLEQFLFVWKVHYGHRLEKLAEPNLSNLMYRFHDIGDKIVKVGLSIHHDVIPRELARTVVGIGYDILSLGDMQFYMDGGKSISEFNELGDKIMKKIESIIGERIG